jgi:putative ABC transport system permease protein
MRILKQQIRQLWRQKFSALVNIIGMSIGFTCCIIIGLYIKNEISYDNFHKRKDQIFRLLSYNPENGQLSANVTYRLGPDCAEYINGVEKSARLYNLWGPNTISYNNKAFIENGLLFTDPSIVDIFSFDFIEGDKTSAFNAPGTAIISKSVSEKYFGNENPLGRIILLDNNTNLTITGVVADFPVNSHFRFNFLVYEPSRLERWGDWVKQSWNFNNFNTYLLLSKNFTHEQFTSEFQSFVQKYVDEKCRKNILNIQLQKLSEIHLHSKSIADDLGPKGDISTIIVYLSIAICILIIACINFISLSISIVSKRVKDASIRIINGAASSNIIGLYIAESITICTISLIFAVLLAGTIHPLLNSYISLYFNIADLNSIPFLLICTCITLLISTLSGLYISNNILKHRASGLIRGHNLSMMAGFSKSYIYLTVQFAISIILIISTVCINKQMRFIQQSDLGYNTDLVLSIPIDKTPETAKTLRDRLLINPLIKDITFSSSFPPNKYHISSVSSPDDLIKGDIQTKNFFVDLNFIDFMKMKIIEGRDFSADFSSDKDQGAIINRAFAEEMGWKSSVGKRIANTWNNKVLVVLGVVENFHFKSFHEKIEPVLISVSLKNDLYHMGIKLSSNDFKTGLSFIKSEWDNLNPGYPFDYHFFDEAIQQNYMSDNRQARIILLFSALAIAVTCLGLIAISVFLAKQRTKEIGIRKINGARVSEVMIMLNKDFVKCITIAFIVAIPVAYYFMNKWLQNFAYQTELSWWIFTLAGLIAFGISLVTVSWQSWKAATRNPVEALRYE